MTTGCGIDTAPLNLYGDSDSVVGDLRFEYRAYNLALDTPYNKVQLKVQAYSMNGNPVDAPITLEVANNAVMELDSNGVLYALTTASNAVVRAYTSVNNVVRRDSVYVNIAAVSPVFKPKKVAFELPPNDSAKQGYSESLRRGKAINVVREDSSGGNMSTLKVEVWGSDNSRAKVTYSGNTATISPVLPGKVVLYLSTYAYGQGFSDTLDYLIAWPVSAYIRANGRVPMGALEEVVEFHPRRITVGVGACVHWFSGANVPVDIQFEDTVGIASPLGNPHCWYELTYEMFSGNIPAFKWNPEDSPGVTRSFYRGRIFTKPGIYKYHSALHNTSGEIVVCNEKEDPTCSPEDYRWEDGR